MHSEITIIPFAWLEPCIPSVDQLNKTISFVAAIMRQTINFYANMHRCLQRDQAHPVAV